MGTSTQAPRASTTLLDDDDKDGWREIEVLSSNNRGLEVKLTRILREWDEDDPPVDISIRKNGVEVNYINELRASQLESLVEKLQHAIEQSRMYRIIPPSQPKKERSPRSSKKAARGVRWHNYS